MFMCAALDQTRYYSTLGAILLQIVIDDNPNVFEES